MISNIYDTTAKAKQLYLDPRTKIVLCLTVAMRYINMMFDMLPIEQLTAIRPVRLDIHFMHECRYGQTLTVGYEQRDGLSLFEVSNGEEAAVRAALEWR